jgi:glycosyltransferase involved in cell wall biosynthesis
MKRLGIFVGEQGNWSFFRHLYEDLRAHYATGVYQPWVFRTPLLHGRLNRWSHRHRIRSLLRNSDGAFFEWASELLETASTMPKYCPIVTRLHAYELYAWGARIDWEAVDRVILVSEAMRRNFAEQVPAYAHKAVVVHNAVNLERYRPAARERDGINIGMLCSFNARKRIYETILMFAKFHSRHPGARLHLGGGRIHAPDLDEYYLACRRLVAKLGLEHAVVFCDHVAAPAEWLQRIDLFISNSYWEGQQVALLEALACGCYCLSHAWSGAEEVLPAEFLCMTDDELFEKALAYADLSPREKVEHHERMRRIACDRFDSQRQTARLREVIEETLAGV